MKTSLKQRLLSRRWLPLCLFALAAGIWVLIEAGIALQQRWRAEEIEAADGIVYFDGAEEEGRDGPVTPAWFRHAVGEEYYGQLRWIDFSTDWAKRSSSDPSKVTDDDLKLLTRFKDATVLDLGNNLGITDEGLVHLRDSQVEDLLLHRTGVTGPGLRHLESLQQLKRLSLEYTPLTDEGLSHLSSRTTLTWLSLGNTQITDEGLRHLAGLHNLERLMLSNTHISDRGLESLHGLTALKYLSLALTDVTASGVEKLEEQLPDCVIYPDSIWLETTPQDQPLWGSSETPTREELLEAVEELGGSADVDLSRPGMPIVRFMLFDSDISDASLLRLLRQMPDLEQLNLRQVQVGDALARELPSWPGLTFVSLDSSRITNDGLSPLCELPNLRELSLVETRISDDGLESLQRMQQLKQLMVDHTWMSAKGILALRDALPNCSVSD